jgi:hypothetical protein
MTLASRLAAASLALLAGALVAPGVGAAEQRVVGLVELQGTAADAEQGWPDNGIGKLRGEDAALRAALEHTLQLGGGFSTHAVAEGYAGAHGTIGITEAWLGWAPVPASPLRHRLRVGAFIPPISLENGGIAWSPERTLTPSVLDAWLGEELRATGLEYELRWLGAQAGSDHDLGLRVGAFWHNDTAGTILSWRGWASNDRVTPYNHTLPLPVRAAFLGGGIYAGKSLITDPFLEIDGDPGYYLAAEWRYRDALRLRAAHYDNEADPMQFKEDQIGWLTRFDSIGAQWQPNEATVLIADWLYGNTLAGSASSPYGVYNEYGAWFVLASRRFAFGTLSARVEGFKVEDLDVNSGDDNDEDGSAYTLAWLREVGAQDTLGVERYAISSSRPDRAALGQPVDQDEVQLRVAFRRSF